MSSRRRATPVRVSRRVLERYLLDDEAPVVATRHHWGKLVEPVATSFVTLLAVAAATANLPLDARAVGTVLWLAWFVVLGRAVWKIVEWRNEWFLATDKRLLLTYGLFTQRVAMMPLAKVTDMNYGRSVLGRLLGYGEFTLESAGQDQALRTVRWIPDPDEKYRRMCATMFGAGLEGVDRGAEDPFEASFDDDASRLNDSFDPDIVRVGVTQRGREQERRRPRWESVERHELPSDWAWVEDEARSARESTRRRVAVDPDPTPLR